ncbi:MAG TPA: heavy metal-associated domain-containing protein [Clostridia bacterium]|nr:heavy metal-associated domain-containing protein [Clostridia bacterium]
METVTKTLQVKGMACAACSSKVEHNISKLEGVIKAVVNLTTGKLTVEYNPEKISIDEISDKVDKLGFQVVTETDLKEITILVEGMN